MQRLGELFNGRAVLARVLSVRHEGPLHESPTAGRVIVNEIEIVVPDSARIRTRARDGASGIEVTSDFSPAPSGMWLWLPCEAVAEAHHFFAQLMPE